MPIIPDTKSAQLSFCETHQAVWIANAAGIGLTAAQANAFKALTLAARAAYDSAQNAKAAWHAAVLAQNNALSLAVGNAADLIRVIKGFAELGSTPDAVYALAQIPAPATPTPATPPGKPTNISITLEPSGAITLEWDASDSAVSGGAFFTVARKLAGQSTFTVLGSAPGSTTTARRMSYTDSTVPTSAAGAGAQYIIQGYRGPAAGEPSDAVIVHFGFPESSGDEGGAGLSLAA